MEMDLEKLDPSIMPEGEIRFVRQMLAHSSPAYGAGFMAEHLTLHLMAERFDYVNEWDNVALVRIGSGGRFEGAALGEAEFLLLTKPEMNRSYPLDKLQGLINRVSLPLMDLPFVSCVEVRVEHKDIEGATPLSYYPGSATPYPGRVLEGEWVAGNKLVFEEARRRVLGEIITDRSILDGMQKAMKEHEAVCNSGLSRKIRQFDADKNTIFYDPDEKRFGLKYGVLRYIQTALSIEIFELIRRRNLPIDDIIDLSQSVEERIRYAFRKDWVAIPDDLIQAGLIYVHACDEQTEMKIRYYSSRLTSSQNESLATWNADAVRLFKRQLLAA
jgi:hypothetical protein